MVEKSGSSYLHDFKIYQEGEGIPVSVHDSHVSVDNICIALPVYSRDLIIGLTSPMGRPLLASHLSERYESLKKPIKINDVFDEVKARFEGTPLNGHLVKLGSKTRGRSTWYGMLDELTDEAFYAFAEEGENIVRSSGSKGKCLERRLAPFISLKELIENPDLEEEEDNKNHLGLTIATVGILTIGSIAKIALTRRDRKQHF